ncbi:MAG TPA: sulfotransferase [Myxococcota bacterium]|nr:sulfotransferase [Myxococcota bacterium]
MFTGPLFIVGAPRSGTKLLRDLVKQHPRIGIPDFETEFLPRMVDKDWGDLSDSRRFNDFYAWVTRMMYFKYMADDGRLIGADTWYRTCESHDLQGVFEALCRIDGDVPFASAAIWGDKSPNYRSHLPLLKQLWPEARFVHIVRDVRDVCLSSHKAWGKHVLRNAQRWADEVRDCCHAGVGDYLQLRYEDLLQDPEQELTRIAEHCDLAFDERMLDPGRASENLGDTKGQRGIVSTNANKWRDRMDAGTQRCIEAVCGSLLSELDYERRYPEEPQRRFSSRQMTRWRLQDGVALMRFRVRDWGLSDAIKYSISQLESTL